MARAKRSSSLLLAVVILFVFAVSAGGCARSGGRGNGAANPGASDGAARVAWQPFALQSGQYFKYEVTDHPVKKKGWVSLEVADKGGGQLEVKWQGEREDGLKLSATSAAKPEQLIVMSRPALVTSPVATPFLAGVLPQWWEKMAGFQMEVGANWSVVLDEMMPAGFTARVEDRCAVAGLEGFKVRLTSGDVVMSEACISPGVPLPLQVRVNDANNQARYEARLMEYRPGK